MKTCESTASSSSPGAMLPSSSIAPVGVSDTIDGSLSTVGGGSSNASSSNSIGASLCVSTRGVQQRQQQQQQQQQQQLLPQQHDLRRDLSPSSFTMQHSPLPYPDNHIIDLHQPYAPDNSDPLSFFLSNGRSDNDPFMFGVGSVADGTFGGRKPTPEELLLFRSHRYLQAEAVGVAMCPPHASGAEHVHKRFSLVSAALSRQVRMKVLEQTNTAVDCVQGLGGNASAAQQQDVISIERRNCHRMLAGILDAATSTLREILASVNNDRGGAAGAGFGAGFSSSVLGSPVTESQQARSEVYTMAVMSNF